MQDVLTDLSAECENLPVEGVPGVCYAHKVYSKTFFKWVQYITLTQAWFTKFNFFLPLQGISQAAGYIYKKLVNDGILNQALSIVPVGVKMFSCMRCGWDIFFISIARIKVLILMHIIAMLVYEKEKIQICFCGCGCKASCRFILLYNFLKLWMPNNK